jgi:hypothetical protein
MSFHQRHLTELVICWFTVLGLAPLAIAQQDLPTPASSTQFGLDGYLGRLAPDLLSKDVSKTLNYQGAVSLIAVPTLSVPAESVKDLEQGRVIGAIFLSSGSNKYKLPPGFYSVFLSKRDNTWNVQFRDNREAVKAEAAATVTETKEEVLRPYVSIEHSVCHRFDKILVCY